MGKKETLVDKVKKDFEDKVRWRELQIKELHTNLNTRIELANVFDQFDKDISTSTFLGESTFEVYFKRVDDARAFINHLLINLPEIEDFSKNMEGWSSEIRFYFMSSYKGTILRVFPADPISGCVPVRKESTSYYWVCERV